MTKYMENIRVIAVIDIVFLLITSCSLVIG
jgi:hypothetical protein